MELDQGAISVQSSLAAFNVAQAEAALGARMGDMDIRRWSDRIWVDRKARSQVGRPVKIAHALSPDENTEWSIVFSTTGEILRIDGEQSFSDDLMLRTYARLPFRSSSPASCTSDTHCPLYQISPAIYYDCHPDYVGNRCVRPCTMTTSTACDYDYECSGSEVCNTGSGYCYDRCSGTGDGDWTTYADCEGDESGELGSTDHGYGYRGIPHDQQGSVAPLVVYDEVNLSPPWASDTYEAHRAFSRVQDVLENVRDLHQDDMGKMAWEDFPGYPPRHYCVNLLFNTGSASDIMGKCSPPAKANYDDGCVELCDWLSVAWSDEDWMISQRNQYLSHEFGHWLSREDDNVEMHLEDGLHEGIPNIFGALLSAKVLAGSDPTWSSDDDNGGLECWSRASEAGEANQYVTDAQRDRWRNWSCDLSPCCSTAIPYSHRSYFDYLWSWEPSPFEFECTDLNALGNPKDNDGDGDANCDDEDCRYDPACSGLASPPYECDDCIPCDQSSDCLPYWSCLRPGGYICKGPGAHSDCRCGLRYESHLNVDIWQRFARLFASGTASLSTNEEIGDFSGVNFSCAARSIWLAVWALDPGDGMVDWLAKLELWSWLVGENYNPCNSGAETRDNLRRALEASGLPHFQSPVDEDSNYTVNNGEVKVAYWPYWSESDKYFRAFRTSYGDIWISYAIDGNRVERQLFDAAGSIDTVGRPSIAWIGDANSSKLYVMWTVTDGGTHDVRYKYLNENGTWAPLLGLAPHVLSGVAPEGSFALTGVMATSGDSTEMLALAFTTQSSPVGRIAVTRCTDLAGCTPDEWSNVAIDSNHKANPGLGAVWARGVHGVSAESEEICDDSIDNDSDTDVDCDDNDCAVTCAAYLYIFGSDPTSSDALRVRRYLITGSSTISLSHQDTVTLPAEPPYRSYQSVDPLDIMVRRSAFSSVMNNKMYLYLAWHDDGKKFVSVVQDWGEPWVTPPADWLIPGDYDESISFIRGIPREAPLGNTLGIVLVDDGVTELEMNRHPY